MVTGIKSAQKARKHRSEIGHLPYLPRRADHLRAHVLDHKDLSDQWRSQYGVDPETFVVILVGKDGGEKLRSTEVVRLEKLYGTIDAMPMRRREMREKG